MRLDILFPIISSLLFFLFGGFLYFQLKKIPLEKNQAHEVASLILDGHKAFSKRAMMSIFQVILYVFIVLYLFSTLFHKPFSWTQMLAFAIGGLLMAIGTHISLVISPMLSPTILQNSKGYLKDGLRIAFKASTSVGCILIGLVLLGLSLCYAFLGPESLIGYALGVILSGFFLRIGGGLYKAGSDIGADILETVEKNIPEFDRRNPATLLDITGDFVGDVIGFVSDILGSFMFAIISCILFSISLIDAAITHPEVSRNLMLLPIYIMSIGLMVSIFCYGFCQFRIKRGAVNNFLLEGLYIGLIICGIATYIVIKKLDLQIDTLPLWGGKSSFLPFPAYIIGLMGGVVIGFTSEVMTSLKYKPAKKIALEAEYGAVIAIFNGMAIGLKSSGLFLIYLILITIPSFYFAGFYGIAMAAMGMLSMTSMIVIVNTFNPIASNALKVAKLGVSHDYAIKNTKKMGQISQTTIAIGSGFTSGATVLSTFSLFFSLVLLTKQDISTILFLDEKLLIGIIIGVSIPFVVSGFLFNGLVKIILKTIKEVSRQYKEIPFLIEGKANPDITKASDTNARLAMDALIIPGIIMGFIPITIGYLFGIKVLLGLVVGTVLTSIQQGFYWANFGESVHNAKHYMESGQYGGKESPTFQHIMTADNVGDAFKDLLSPSVNILMKAITIISIFVILLITLT